CFFAYASPYRDLLSFPTRRSSDLVSPRTKSRSLEMQLLVLVPLALTAFGLVMVYSATSASAALGNGNPVGYLERQSVYALVGIRSEEHTSELQSLRHLVCRLLLEK